MCIIFFNFFIFNKLYAVLVVYGCKSDQLVRFTPVNEPGRQMNDKERNEPSREVDSRSPNLVSRPLSEYSLLSNDDLRAQSANGQNRAGSPACAII